MYNPLIQRISGHLTRGSKVFECVHMNTSMCVYVGTVSDDLLQQKELY